MRKTKLAESKQEAIRQARELVEQDYGCNPRDRRWLVGVAPHSYDRKEYHTEINVLEGSSPKGYVLITSRLGGGTVIAFDHCLKELRRIEWSE